MDSITSVISSIIAVPGRVSAIAASTNKVFIGSDKGDIIVVDGQNGNQILHKYKDKYGKIEGIMFDYQSRIIYATENSLVILDHELQNKIKEIEVANPISNQGINIVLTWISGRRIISSLDHRIVYWWGDKLRFNEINLETLESKEHRLPVGIHGSKLITYDVLTFNQKLIYVLFEEGSYKMIYYYDLKLSILIGVWRYCNTLRSLSSKL